MSKTLTVGVDASRAFEELPTGTEHYSRRVIEQLARGRHELRLYVRRTPAGGAPAGADVRVLSAPRLWTHVALATELALRPPDALFVPAHVLPLVVRVPTVVTVHDLGHRRFPAAHTRAQRLYLEWTARRHAVRATCLLADSESTRADLSRFYGVPAERVVVAPLGVDEDMRPSSGEQVAAARAAVGLAPGRDYVLYVGTLQPRKNLARLLLAWQAVARERPDVDLVLAGKAGWGGEDLPALARRLGVAERVRFPGYVPRARLPGLYSGALALAHPSLYEGFGLTVAEAMACGTPVLVARSSSLPEVVGPAGLLVDPLEPREIAAGLQRLLGDDNLRRRLAAAGRARAARFTWEACGTAVVRAVERAAGV